MTFLCIAAPKPCLRLNRLAAVWFFYDTFFPKKVQDRQKQLKSLVLFDDEAHFLKTPNRRGALFHAEKLSNFLLTSDLDPIRDQNGVRYFVIFVNILDMFGISSTVPTYGTAYIPTYSFRTEACKQ